MAFNGTNMAQGAAGGAAAGSMAGPWGTAIGAGVGALAGGFSGGDKNYGFSKDDLTRLYATRGAEINDFQSQLASMRSQYLAQIPGLQQQSFNQFGNDAAANFAAKGMTAGGGAFQSALAREAIPMTANMINTGYQSGVSNAGAVNSARAGAFGSMMGAESAGMSAPSANPMWAGLGQFAGQVGTMYAAKNMFNPTAPTTPGSTPAAISPTQQQGSQTWKDYLGREF